jgi:general secretion pathway protein E
VRRLCRECAAPHEPSRGELAALGLPPDAKGTWRVPRGCRACEGQGYRGRVGLFELLELDGPLRELVFRGASLEEIRATALATGRLDPLLSDGAAKVAAGLTTTAEVLRVARSGAADAE